jgi:type II secretory ATPase GspE/PulE/Tfp pilus assembly ATPase PilB-like protein
VKITPTPEVLAALGLKQDATLSKGRGCLYCHGAGFRGRLGIFELLPLDDGIRRLAMQRAASTDITNYAITQGMRTMRDDGIEKALKGATTAEEVIRATRSR